MVKGSSKKRERFTSPGLGLACDVLAGEQYRQRQGLDRGAKLKPFFVQSFNNLRMQPEVGELLLCDMRLFHRYRISAKACIKKANTFQ